MLLVKTRIVNGLSPWDEIKSRSAFASAPGRPLSLYFQQLLFREATIFIFSAGLESSS